MIAIGRISAVYGIKGWVKVFSLTDPRENVFRYQPWVLVDARGKETQIELEDWRAQGKYLIAAIRGCTDRNKAQDLVGLEIQVPESAIPPPEKGEVYWRDLMGIAVFDRNGRKLGTVQTLLETGANDVLVVKGDATSIDRQERLIPWVRGQYIIDVDVPASRLVVDWDAEWDEL